MIKRGGIIICAPHESFTSKCKDSKHKLIKAFNDGNLAEARKLQQKSIDMIELLGKYGGMATGKAYMKLAGLDCGNFRPPVSNMPDGMFSTFVKDVKELGIDDLFSKK